MYMIDSDEKVIVFTNLNELNRLDPALKEQLLNKCLHHSEDYSEIVLNILDRSFAEMVGFICEKKERNAERRLRRNEAEFTNSAGYHTPSDIRDIIQIQNNACYFSGEKLVHDDKNWQVDHLVPVSSGGSFWPVNLAVITKEANQEKHGYSKKKYWETLEGKHGKKWVAERKLIATEIDGKRKKLHAIRVHALKTDIAKIQARLKQTFNPHDISLTLLRDIIYLEVDGVEIAFPKGMPRKRRYFKSADYFVDLTRLLIF